VSHEDSTKQTKSSNQEARNRVELDFVAPHETSFLTLADQGVENWTCRYWVDWSEHPLTKIWAKNLKGEIIQPNPDEIRNSPWFIANRDTALLDSVIKYNEGKLKTESPLLFSPNSQDVLVGAFREWAKNFEEPLMETKVSPKDLLGKEDIDKEACPVLPPGGNPALSYRARLESGNELKLSDRRSPQPADRAVVKSIEDRCRDIFNKTEGPRRSRRVEFNYIDVTQYMDTIQLSGEAPRPMQLKPLPLAIQKEINESNTIIFSQNSDGTRNWQHPSNDRTIDLACTAQRRGSKNQPK
jgi:hypothetical protein